MTRPVITVVTDKAMQTLTRLQIGGFRRFKRLDVAMRPLMVLIGANGVGKTSFLDSLLLLSESAKGRLEDYVSRSGGLQAMLSGMGRNESISLAVDLDSSLGPDIGEAYGFSLRKSGYGYEVHGESVSGSEKASATETAVGQNRTADAPRLREILSIDMYKAIDFNKNGKAKDPQPLTQTASPGSCGEHLLSCLYNLRERNPDDYEDLLFVLKTAFPLFEKLSLPLVANGTVGLQWWEKGLDIPLSSHQLSEGTLRFLWLATALAVSNPAPLTVIDEPEVSLHPELLRYLAELMRSASSRTQIVVATHSDRLIRFLKPSEVAVMDWDDDGAATVTWADGMNLEGWLEEYTLDQIWEMGRLGGRA